MHLYCWTRSKSTPSYSKTPIEFLIICSTLWEMSIWFVGRSVGWLVGLSREMPYNIMPIYPNLHFSVFILLIVFNTSWMRRRSKSINSNKNNNNNSNNIIINLGTVTSWSAD